MLTDLEIVNNALGRLNCERIVSLDDNNKRAKIAKDYLSNSRKVALEFGPWDFALTRATLTSIGTPEFEYQHLFCKPEDLISIVSEFNESEYFVEGDNILSDAPTLLIKYVKDIDENTKRSASFDKAWYLALASEMAYSLTQNTGLKDSLMAEASLLAPSAMHFNSKGSTPISYEIDTFLDSRL